MKNEGTREEEFVEVEIFKAALYPLTRLST
jgi:hypothetical protein